MYKKEPINTYKPDYLVTPGELLEDYLEFAGLTQASLAERTGLSKKTINEIMQGKSAITPETALRFERIFNRPAHFWNNLERHYQEEKIRLADKIKLEQSLLWLKNFPINEMVKNGWIEKFKDKAQQIDAVLKFFAIATIEQWNTIWNRELQIAFRKTAKTIENKGIISAWLRQGEIEAQNIDCAPYNRASFLSSLNEIRKFTTLGPQDFVTKLISICKKNGVAVVFVPALPKMRIYGATRWLKNKYVIQLSLFLKTNDQFWFSFFHEACHIIKHSRKELFIEGDRPKNEIEKEADTFAENILIPPGQYRKFVASGRKPSLQDIELFAKSIDIAPGIVAGRLQHDSIIPMSYGNELKVRYEWM